MILGGNLNLVLDCNLEACDCNPVLRKVSLSKIIEIEKNLNLCDIWRIGNFSLKSFIWFHSKKIRLLFRIKCSTETCEKN